MEKHSVSMPSRVFKTESMVFQKICQEINSPRALAASLLLKHGEYDQFLSLEINPSDYSDVAKFRDDYLITKVLSKSQSIPTGYNLEEIAYGKWLSAEKQCCDTNVRIQAYEEGLCTPTKPHISAILDQTRSEISDVLGSLTSRTLDRVVDECDFGPGATTSVSRVVTRGRKYSFRTITTTKRLLSFGLFCTPDLWRRNIEGFSVNDCSKLSFVPKNSKTHRAIAVENDLNIFVQKGIGSVIKQRLFNSGVDLSRQPMINKRLASNCWKSGGCTIDLSAASDTVSRSVVWNLLPFDWASLLDYARTDSVSYKGKEILLEKFSSMGNGFTFELETLIFLGVLRAARRLRSSTHEVAAFGDDLICGLDIFDDVVDTLEFLGFSVNREKTFGKGLFHESCGGDYFQGIDVRPVFLKYGDRNAEIEIHYYLYANLLRRWAYNRHDCESCDGRILPAWLHCFTAVRKSRRFRVPSWDYSTQGFVSSFDEAVPSVDRTGRCNGWSGYSFRYLDRGVSTTRSFSLGAYIGSLRKQTDFSYGRESMRGQFEAARTRSGYVLTWPDYGQWF